MGEAALLTLERLNALDREEATRAFLRCCGSSKWAAAMAAARPFDSVDALREDAQTIWGGLDAADWLAAFAAHPKIGARGSGWAAQEQASVALAERETLARLASANREYEARFGYIFIVCATGKSAGEMLALLETRLRHDAGRELLVAAEEQRRITQLRLSKLLEEEPDRTP